MPSKTTMKQDPEGGSFTVSVEVSKRPVDVRRHLVTIPVTQVVHATVSVLVESVGLDDAGIRLKARQAIEEIIADGDDLLDVCDQMTGTKMPWQIDAGTPLVEIVLAHGEGVVDVVDLDGVDTNVSYDGDVVRVASGVKTVDLDVDFLREDED